MTNPEDVAHQLDVDAAECVPVQDEPEGLEETVLTSALRQGWSIDVDSVQYLPVGAGSYHGAASDRAGDRFITVDDLGLDRGGRATILHDLQRSYATAVALQRDVGLGFLVAPLHAADGQVLRRLTSRYALSVFPMVEGTAVTSVRTDLRTRRRWSTCSRSCTWPPPRSATWPPRRTCASPSGRSCTTRSTRWTGRGPADPTPRWVLADVAAYVEDLREPHGDGADAAAALTHLTAYLEGTAD